MNDQQHGASPASQTAGPLSSSPRDSEETNGAVNTHMAIGEVLALLQEEFPDVTISKIRFLESQGLIAPERTASGYRKFYEADIDRLRWILLQQRDNFLPLKVIKNMLDSGVSTDMGNDEPTLFSDPDSQDGTQEIATDGSSTEEQATAGAKQSPSHPAARGFVDRSVPMSPASSPSSRSSEIPSRLGDKGTSGTGAGEAQGRERSQTTNPASRRPEAPQAPRPESPSTQPVRQHTTPADVVAALQELPGATRRPRSAQRAEPLTIPSRTQDAHQELTLEELSERTGADVELIEALLGFGLIFDRNLAGTRVFDPPAEEICRLAVRYQELGVEPRHLRMYKVAAEREAGFIEQSAIPLLKKRNPSARTAAKERAEELMGLGNQLEKLLLIDRLQSVLEL